MSESVPVPKWLFLGVIGPLMLIAIINGVRTYYGQKALNKAVANLNSTVEELYSTVESLPTKSEINSKRNFLVYRIDRLEDQVQANTDRIKKNRDAISRLSAAESTIWYSPLVGSTPKPRVAKLSWFPKLSGREEAHGTS